MSILICGRRDETDKYASAKSLGEWSLAASLIADDIKDLYDIARGGQEMQKYYWALVVILALSLLFQLIALVFALILYFRRYPGDASNANSTLTTEVEMTSAANPPEPDGNHSNDNPQRTIKPPVSMQRLNDALTILAVLVAVFHVLKNGLKSNIVETES